MKAIGIILLVLIIVLVFAFCVSFCMIITDMLTGKYFELRRDDLDKPSKKR